MTHFTASAVVVSLHRCLITKPGLCSTIKVCGTGVHTLRTGRTDRAAWPHRDVRLTYPLRRTTSLDILYAVAMCRVRHAIFVPTFAWFHPFVSPPSGVRASMNMHTRNESASDRHSQLLYGIYSEMLPYYIQCIYCSILPAYATHNYSDWDIKHSILTTTNDNERRCRCAVNMLQRPQHSVIMDTVQRRDRSPGRWLSAASRMRNSRCENVIIFHWSISAVEPLRAYALATLSALGWHSFGIARCSLIFGKFIVLLIHYNKRPGLHTCLEYVHDVDEDDDDDDKDWHQTQSGQLRWAGQSWFAHNHESFVRLHCSISLGRRKAYKLRKISYIRLFRLWNIFDFSWWQMRILNSSWMEAITCVESLGLEDPNILLYFILNWTSDCI